MAEQINKTRRQLQGVVISDKMDKTITVQVSTYKTHPIYMKRVAYFKKYKAHDEKNAAKVGDTVLIEETRHLSKDKYFRLIEIVKKGEQE